jgi:hypothetical protein
MAMFPADIGSMYPMEVAFVGSGRGVREEPNLAMRNPCSHPSHKTTRPQQHCDKMVRAKVLKIMTSNQINCFFKCMNLRIAAESKILLKLYQRTNLSKTSMIINM